MVSALISQPVDNDLTRRFQYVPPYADRLIRDLDPAYSFSDASLTVGNEIDEHGALVAGVFDHSGLAQHATQSTEALRPIWNSGANGIAGRPAWSFSGDKRLELAGLNDDLNDGFTMFVVSKVFARTGSAKTLMGWNNNLAIKRSYSTSANGDAFSVGAQTVTSPIQREDVTVTRVTVDEAGSLVTVSNNRAETSAALAGALNFASNTFAIGNLLAGGSAWPGLIGRVLIYAPNLTEAEAAIVEEGLAQYAYGLYPDVLVPFGNSFIAGVGPADTSQSITAFLGRYLDTPDAHEDGVTHYMNVLGFSGLTTTQLLGTTYTDQLFPYLDAPRDRRIVFLCEATNDMCASPSNKTAQQAYDNTVALTAAIKSRSPLTKVVVPTVLPRDAASADGANPSGTFEARRLAYNALVRAGGNWDGLADVAAHSAFAANASPGGPANTDYFDALEIHPNERGCPIYARIVAAAIQDLG